MVPELDVICDQSPRTRDAVLLDIGTFLRAYSLSIEGGPYAINAEWLGDNSGGGYTSTVRISPVGSGKIVAIIPHADAPTGSFLGVNAKSKELAISILNLRYLVQLENLQPTTQTTSRSKRRATSGRREEYTGPDDEPAGP